LVAHVELARPLGVQGAGLLSVLPSDMSDPCWSRTLFSAKESVYKAWFPLTRRWLGYNETIIGIDPSTVHSQRV
jgi:4'-phosphopantetheinyl transferase EntD